MARMPPVDVPTIKSKYSPMVLGRLVSSSFNIAAGKVPSIPPLSMQRIRLGLADFVPVFHDVWLVLPIYKFAFLLLLC